MNRQVNTPELKLWKLVLFILIGLGNTPLYASDAFTPLVYQKGNADSSVMLQPYMMVLVDTTGHVDMNQILAKKTDPFTKQLPDKIHGKKTYVLAQFKLTNNSGIEKHSYFSFCGGTTEDSVWLYKVEGDKFRLQSISGNLVF